MTDKRIDFGFDETLTACPVCGSADIPIFLHMKVTGYNDLLLYANCMTCGQVFLNPRMSDERTRQYYQGEYRRRLFGEGGTNEQDLTAMRLRASLQAQVLTLWNVVPFTVLDVGSAAGYLLWEWDKRGARATGIEPDRRYHTLTPANRYTIYGDIAEAPEGTRYDLICMSHSLEHMNHPKEYLRDLLAKHAKEDTRLMIEVPNTECCKAAYQVHHPMAFTRYTLEKLLNGLGWEIERILYHALSNNVLHRYLLVLAKRSRDAA